MTEKRRIELDHVTIIVPLGKGKEVLELAKIKGITNGTVSVGTGTANKEILEKLNEKSETLKRDVVSIVTASDLANIFLKELSEKFGLGKPNHGIAFASNVNEVYTENITSDDRQEAQIQVITSIVKHGTSCEMMQAARNAGAKGGTVLEPSEITSENSLLSKDTNGSDEVILIIAKKDNAQQIMEAIKNEDKESKAIIYVQDAHYVYGLK